jgi:hypothetical protein
MKLMKCFRFAFWVVLLVAVSGATGFARGAEGSAEPTRARGVVFHDANDNQVFDEGDKPLVGIRVSNGREIATTDESGRYELPVGDDTILFVLKPRGGGRP